MNPKDLAKQFCEMNTQEQALFFTTIADLTSEWKGSFYEQMKSMVGEEKILTKEAKNIMRDIGTCSLFEYQGVGKKTESVKLKNGDIVKEGDLVYFTNSDEEVVIDKIKRHYKTKELYFWNRNFKIQDYPNLKKVKANTILSSIEELEEYKRRCNE